MPIGVREATELLPEGGLLIGDRWVRETTGGEYTHRYPGTGETHPPVPLAGPAEVDDAVVAARAAFTAWKRTPPDQRRQAVLRLADLIEQHADELTALSVLDAGTPVALAGMGAHTSVDALRYCAGWMDKLTGETVPTWPKQSLDYTLNEPYGVVAVIIPWNTPVFAIGTALAPVLAAGNCVIVKPPELAPFSLLRFGQLCLDAGLPPGLVNIIPGGPAAGDALVRHPGVDKVHFTGSGPTARKVLHAAADSLTPVTLELGGKSANLVFSDADLDVVVPQAVITSIVVLSGQACLAPTRLLVERSVYREVVDRAVAVAESIPVGDPFDPTKAMGPVISDEACTRIVDFVQRAAGEGAGKLVTGGARLGGDLAEGYYVPPTVFADVDNSSDLAQHEIFGPVLCIIPFDDEAHGIELANQSDFGLAGFIQTNDVRRAHRVAAALDAGYIFVNGFDGMPAGAPFGGMKQSGFGRVGGLAGIREFLRPKNVYVALDEPSAFA